MYDHQNTIFKLAVQFVNQTNRHLFLTGKAGTGKTTFLRYIYNHTPKKTVIVAPTGVAAINAGGVTIHSFFQLPFGAYLPVTKPVWGSDYGQFHTIYSFLKNAKVSKERRELIQEMELLIIDEVSMVRADLLDTIDASLRHIRRNPQPFGGVQVLYIGDLFQLPPVVKDDEWNVLRQYYKTPFFFGAHVIEQTAPLYLELTKIYRQKDSTFIEILNNIRNNKVLQSDLDTIHQFYKPDFQPPRDQNYITLTSHTAKADTINRSELEALNTEVRTFKAEITGDFGEKSFPADEVLELKENAQIMFIRNDKGDNRRYYNGKIATIKSIAADSITVEFPDGTDIVLEKESWKNIKYQFNNDNDSFEEKVLGEFKQYPIRLAWAITIHKSQGLTFEKAIIDAGASFAAGQVYVALSRLTNMEGMVLLSQIKPSSITADQSVLEFCKRGVEEQLLEEQFKEDRKQYIHTLLLKTFEWAKVTDRLEYHYNDFARGIIPDKSEAAMLAEKWFKLSLEQKSTADKFIAQLSNLIAEAQVSGYERLQERIDKAEQYFNSSLNEILSALGDHIIATRKKKRTTKYVKTLKELEVFLLRKVGVIKAAQRIAYGLVSGTETGDLLEELQVKEPVKVEEEPENTAKRTKGDSHRISLDLYKSGKSVKEIATERDMAESTIEGHLTSFIGTGEIKVEELVSAEKLPVMLNTINELGMSLGVLKEKLGSEYSYAEIKAAIAYHKTISEAH